MILTFPVSFVLAMDPNVVVFGIGQGGDPRFAHLALVGQILEMTDPVVDDQLGEHGVPVVALGARMNLKRQVKEFEGFTVCLQVWVENGML